MKPFTWNIMVLGYLVWLSVYLHSRLLEIY